MQWETGSSACPMRLAVSAAFKEALVKDEMTGSGKRGTTCEQLLDMPFPFTVKGQILNSSFKLFSILLQ